MVEEMSTTQSVYQIFVLIQDMLGAFVNSASTERNVERYVLHVSTVQVKVDVFVHSDQLGWSLSAVDART